jgi:hypothetical protein
VTGIEVELRPLVTVPDVLDGEIVEIELTLDLPDVAMVGVDGVDPYPRPVIEA